MKTNFRHPNPRQIMDSKVAVKPKRHKKKKPRTQVSSDDESEAEKTMVLKRQEEKSASTPKAMNNADVSAAFSKYYLQRVTQEFGEDLDRVRAADDFKDDAFALLVNALQQGTSVYSNEEQRRIVTGVKTRE